MAGYCTTGEKECKYYEVRIYEYYGRHFAFCLLANMWHYCLNAGCPESAKNKNRRHDISGEKQGTKKPA
jgi:hypothetical protein